MSAIHKYVYHINIQIFSNIQIYRNMIRKYAISKYNIKTYNITDQIVFILGMQGLLNI